MESEIREAGASLAAIGLGDANYARLFREETGITFPLLIDEERRAYKVANLRKANLLHLFRRHNLAARKEAKTAGHRQHKLGKDPFQLGGQECVCERAVHTAISRCRTSHRAG